MRTGFHEVVLGEGTYRAKVGGGMVHLVVILPDGRETFGEVLDEAGARAYAGTRERLEKFARMDQERRARARERLSLPPPPNIFLELEKDMVEAPPLPVFFPCTGQVGMLTPSHDPGDTTAGVTIERAEEATEA
jgi:hypothetical protein